MAPPLSERREFLEDKILSKLKEPVRYSPRLEASPADLIHSMKTQGFEGLVAKNLTSKYGPACARKETLSKSAAAQNVEQWAVNKAVHYNAWANFGCSRCDTCDSWVHVTPRVNPETLRCLCNGVSLNLKTKAKVSTA